MDNWSISKRVGLGLGGVTLLTLVIGLVAVTITTLMGSSFDTYRDLARRNLTLADLSQVVYKIEMAAKNYRLQPTTDRAAEVTNYLSQFDQKTTDANALFAANPEQVTTLQNFVQLLSGYQDNFVSVTSLQEIGDASTITLSESGVAARKALTKTIQSARLAGDQESVYLAGLAQESFLRGRFHAQKFLLDNDPESLKTAVGHAEWAQFQLGKLRKKQANPIRQKATDDTVALLTQFIDASNNLGQAIAERNAAFENMGNLTQSMLFQMTEFQSGFVDEQNTVGPRLESAIAQYRVLIVIFAVISIPIAAFMAITTIKVVRKRLSQTLIAVRELANGNLDAEIQDADKPHEIGEIARALIVFQDNAKDAAKLASQNEIAEREKWRSQRENEEARQKQAAAQASAEKQAIARHQEEIFQSLQTALSGVVGAAVSGDFSQRVDATTLDPELAQLASQINALMSNVDDGISEVNRVSARLATGDLRRGMDGTYAGVFAELQNNIAQMIHSLNSLIGNISSQATTVQSQSGELTKYSEDLAQRARAQAAALEETTVAVTGIAKSANSNATEATETQSAAISMSEEAEKSQVVLRATTSAMGEIEACSEEINAIVDVIEDIAFQTNLLSLNASVEAARAGDAGKGFAVVANEVRSLAQRSSDASSKVQDIIRQSNAAISKGASAVNETGAVLGEIVARIQNVAGSLDTIKNLSDDQAKAVEEVTTTITNLDSVTQRNAEIAAESRTSAEQLTHGAHQMTTAMSQFQFLPADAIDQIDAALPNRAAPIDLAS
jgi:methyl-accepting chemotaxis protein